ncbi:hypothetical protein [Radicibacter daui]|uniref:hypothetical protein n=1 Tax=Radicibacter daui TaxID=3064829 RepID=UPI004046E91B
MRRVLKIDRTAGLLLGTAALLVLFNLVATVLTITVNPAFRQMVEAGLFLTGAYALIGAGLTLRLALRHARLRGARHRHPAA